MGSINNLKRKDKKQHKRKRENVEHKNISKIHEISSSKKSESSEILRINKKNSLENLPVDVLVKIFKFLSPNDLIALAIVSKKFNDAIDKSGKILRKFHVEFFNQNENLNLLMDGKCSKVFSISLLENFAPLRIIGDSIDSLEFVCDAKNLEKLREIILICKNLRNLRINVSSIMADGVEIEALPKLDLNKLEIFDHTMKENGEKFLEIFQNLRVKILKFYGGENFFNSIKFKNFIKNQKELQEMTAEVIDFFNDNQLNHVNFKLLKFESSYGSNLKFLSKFLRNHKNTMKHLKIQKITKEIANTLNEFTKLESLSVFGEISLNYTSTTLITKLEVPHINQGFHLQYPNVVDLTILNFTDDHQIQNLKNLHSLQIIYPKLSNAIKLPESLKVLRLYSHGNCNSFKPFEGSRLEELEVSFLQNSPPIWLIEYLKKSETRLKMLKIANQLPDFIHSAIEENRFKIDYLEIYKD